jgi:GntR family transcriptional regulator, sialic acid-inducible nan operon repressor
LEPIQRRKLYQEVAERLLDQIRSGAVQPGDQLPSERQLMELFGVGRPAIREALLTLQKMGLIAIAHGERARVLEPTAGSVVSQVGELAQHLLATSPQNLEHLKEARLFFEVGMVRIAAASAGAEEIAALDRAIRDQEAATRDRSAFLAQDIVFHRTIAAVSRNPIYVALSQAMLEWLGRAHIDLVRAPGAEKLTLDEHRAILDRIRARDVEGAATAMTAHLTRANTLYGQLLTKSAGRPRRRSRALAGEA